MSAPTQKAQAKGPELFRMSFSSGELTPLCLASIDAAKKRIDAIPALPEKERTIDNTLLALERVLADFGDTADPLIFMGYISTDPKTREEGSKCEEAVSQFKVSIATRKDLYQAVKDSKPRNGDEQRLLSETIRIFEDNGLKLSDEKLKEFRETKQQLTALETEFMKNLNEDKTTLEFTEKELEGAQPEFLARLKKSPEGKFLVTTKSPDYLHVTENVKVAESRRKMMFAYQNRAAPANVSLVEKAIVLRQKLGQIMNKPTYADLQLSGRMATSSKEVMDFLSGLRGKLAKRNKSDLAVLLKAKQKEIPGSKELNAWDVNYYANQVLKNQYSLDKEKVREYFPADLVIKGMFEIYSTLLGVEFVQVADAVTWHPDVKLYQTRDRQTQKTLSYFFMDLFPREGKYSHAAAFPLISGRVLPSGQYSVPIASIVANYNPPAAGKPSLLSHDEVETTFHEFGHIMHQTLTRAPFASLSGSSTARDFVEAPSQMLENWVWSPKMLKLISGHYQTSEKLPDAMIKQMLATRNFNKGHFYSRQLLFGTLDMTYHTSKGPVNATETYDRLFKEITGLDPLKGAHFPANFGHLMGGYDAGYYGYLWSEVYAEDMFTEFEKKGLLSAETGSKYRQWILEQGNMKPARELVTAFLGREPNSKAFFKKLGIK